MFGLKFGIDDSFVVSKKCVCVNCDLLGHFSHFMFSAGGGCSYTYVLRNFALTCQIE